jgi:hypothetical protein
MSPFSRAASRACKRLALESRPLLAALAALLCAAAPAGAQEMSANVERVASVPELKSAIAINFIEDTMFVSTVTGIYAYSVSDPGAPSPVGALPMYIWENEDVDVDPKRKLLFVSRDPRGFTSPATPGSAFPYGAVHIIDVSLPHAMTQVGFFTLGAGHTTTCVNACDFIWTAGPGANAQTQPADWKGRPVLSTDVTDPADPKPCPEPIDLGRDDGVTNYAHDVQVDSRGVAWVSGAGGVRGYWTSGSHVNPLTGAVETATGCKPIPYAGSGTPEEATPSRFMHNSFRDPGPEGARALQGRAGSPAAWAAKKKSRCNKGSKAKRKRCRAKQRRRKKVAPAPRPAPAGPVGPSMRERVLYGTEEALSDACEASGRFVTYDLEGTFGGEGFKDTATTRHRMKALDTWTPENAEGASGCASAHYFTSRGDGIFANAFYEQGVRFLDVSDPRDIRQVGWYRPADSNTWAAYWRDGLTYVADFTRGVDILKFSGSPRSKAVRAPALPERPAERFHFDRAAFGGLCPVEAPRP